MERQEGRLKRGRSPPYPPFVENYAPYTGSQLRRACAEKSKENHKQHWDLYYRNNTVNGYRDRHYILREFVELREAIETARRANESGGAVAASFSWMEAGCGVGNAVLPIFEAHGDLPQWRSLLGFDISSVAIALLKEKVQALPAALAGKVHVCVLDPCERDVAECTFFACGDGATQGVETDLQKTKDAVAVPRSPPLRVEFVSMVFVLCSIPVAKHALVLRRIAACMTQRTGVFFFRDYCVADHAETRFRKRDERVGRVDSTEDASTFTRTNGTLSHFFSTEEVDALFTSVGFTVVELREVEREMQNRKTESVLSRRFLQGRFRLAGAPRDL